MSDFDFQVTFEDDGMFHTVEDVVNHLGAWVESVARPVVANEVGPGILQEAQSEPGPPKRRRPVRNPYIRTHRLSRNWLLSMESVPTGGLIVTLGNETPYYQWVEGPFQTESHQETGWLYAPDKSIMWANALVSAIVVSLNEAWDELSSK